MAETAIAKSLIQHFGRREENVGALPPKSFAREDDFIALDRAVAGRAAEPFPLRSAVGVVPDHVSQAVFGRAADEIA